MAEFYNQTVVVETYRGTSGYGVDLFDAPVTLAPDTDTGCFVEGGRNLVRAKDGAQVISESTLYTYPASAPLFAPDSRVTINGVESRVITVNVNASGDLDLPDHVVVSLT